MNTNVKISKSQISNKSEISRISKKSQKSSDKSKFPTFQNNYSVSDDENDPEDSDPEDNRQELNEEEEDEMSQNISITSDSIGQENGTKSARSKLSTKPSGISSNYKQNEPISLRNFKTNNDKNFYTISALKFSQFEGMLFDLIGLPNTNVFKPADCLKDTKQASDQKKIETLEKHSNTFINDLNLLNDKLEQNVFNENHLKFLKIDKDSNANNSRKSGKSIRSFKENEENSGCSQSSSNPKANVLTVIHHVTGGPRPRKALRILINRKNTEKLDMVLNEVCNLFKLEYANVRRLFTLSGGQIEDPNELFNQEAVFIVMGNEKLHNKDFELEPDEKTKFFANEFMKNVYSNKFCKQNKPKKSEAISNNRGFKEFNKGKNNNNNIDKINLNKKFQPKVFLPDDLLSNYEIGEVIGEGHYAVVHKCKDINTGLVFALKIIDLKKCVNKENMIENELEILRKIKHTNIVKLIEEYKSKDYVYLIMEFLKAGDLLEDLTLKKKYEESEAHRMISDLTSAVAYLHSQSIVHRDVKLENILIQNLSDGSQVLKLGDFGLAIKLDKGKLNQKCGSPIYVAPEILFGKSYASEVDVWSLGVITYILLCGFAPFQGDNDEKTFELIKNSELIFQQPYWDNISSDAKDLVKKMLDRNQETRIKAENVMKHPWIINNGQNFKSGSKSLLKNYSTNNVNKKSPRKKSPSYSAKSYKEMDL